MGEDVKVGSTTIKAIYAYADVEFSTLEQCGISRRDFTHVLYVKDSDASALQPNTQFTWRGATRVVVETWPSNINETMLFIRDV